MIEHPVPALQLNTPRPYWRGLLDSANGGLWRETVDFRLKIMVSPIRIRVPPLDKVLQKRENQGLAALPGPLVNSVSTAGLRNCFFEKWP
jgi:hypothetical protein